MVPQEVRKGGVSSQNAGIKTSQNVHFDLSFSQNLDECVHAREKMETMEYGEKSRHESWRKALHQTRQHQAAQMLKTQREAAAHHDREEEL